MWIGGGGCVSQTLESLLQGRSMDDLKGGELLKRTALLFNCILFQNGKDPREQIALSPTGSALSIDEISSGLARLIELFTLRAVPYCMGKQYILLISCSSLNFHKVYNWH